MESTFALITKYSRLDMKCWVWKSAICSLFSLLVFISKLRTESIHPLRQVLKINPRILPALDVIFHTSELKGETTKMCELDSGVYILEILEHWLLFQFIPLPPVFSPHYNPPTGAQQKNLTSLEAILLLFIPFIFIASLPLRPLRYSVCAFSYTPLPCNKWPR